jgi:Tol biopolymer transport system component
VNADGSGLRRLTRNAAADDEAAWSPDGRKIAFISWRDSGAAEIYVMNADGTDQRRLTRNTRGRERSRLVADGTKIAFSRTGAGELRDVYVMNADGTQPRQLTATRLQGNRIRSGHRTAARSPTCRTRISTMAPSLGSTS